MGVIAFKPGNPFSFGLFSSEFVLSCYYAPTHCGSFISYNGAGPTLLSTQFRSHRLFQPYTLNLTSKNLSLLRTGLGFPIFRFALVLTGQLLEKEF